VSTEASVPALADELMDTLLAADPFLATGLGLREYDALLPDPTAEAEDALAADLAAIAARAAELRPQTRADVITAGVIRAVCEQRRKQLACRSDEFTVSAMPIGAAPALCAIAARTVLPDAQAAADYLSRLRSAPRWLDGTTERLREGRAKGRLPVGELVDQAIGWADRTLATPLPAAFTRVAAPADWAGAAGWRDELEDVVRERITPAIGRWRDLLVELRPHARTGEQAGLDAIPGGADDYARLVGVHTTLELTPGELHRIGLDTMAQLTEEALDLGAELGLSGLDEIVVAARLAATGSDPHAAIAAAQAAIARAESRADELMPAPLPAPCAVEPMPQSVGDSGMAPHYTRPRRDGSRPGTFWFNTLRATAGTGWDLEAVAFHEAVPGHHSQLARLQLLPDLPLLQQMSMTVHAEGWGLYAEKLAEEVGLYSGSRARLGLRCTTMLRAARLVVDTGLHAFGWSRERAVGYMLDHVALPESFLVNEVDRYIAWPGQALAYLSGQREILRLRAEARAALGAGFDLPGFHAAVLDSGSVPMPVLADIVAGWVADRSGPQSR
jgi:uncharacterized protein (DUF885 family)